MVRQGQKMYSVSKSTQSPSVLWGTTGIINKLRKRDSDRQSRWGNSIFSPLERKDIQLEIMEL